MNGVKAPILTLDDVSCKAEELRQDSGWDGSIPVDVEQTAEIYLGIEIVPVRGLMERFATDAFITLDFERIVVDESVLERQPKRYRFTLAHEIGHRILHSGVFGSLEVTSEREWVEFYLSLSDHDYGWFERQAYWFAGALLIPEVYLIEEFNKADGQLESQGLDCSILSLSSKNRVAGYLARKLDVSTAVVHRRLMELDII